MQQFSTYTPPHESPLSPAPRMKLLVTIDPLSIIISTGAAYEPRFRPILEQYCCGLDAEGVFDDLAWIDAAPWR